MKLSKRDYEIKTNTKQSKQMPAAAHILGRTAFNSINKYQKTRGSAALGTDNLNMNIRNINKHKKYIQKTHKIEVYIRQNRQAHSIKFTGAFAKMDWRMHNAKCMCAFAWVG